MVRTGRPHTALAAGLRANEQAIASMAAAFGPSTEVLAPRKSLIDHALEAMLAAAVADVGASSGYARGLWPGRMPGGRQAVKWGRPGKNAPAHQGKRECARRMAQLERGV